MFRFVFLEHQGERYREKCARTPYRMDSELRHGKCAEKRTKREQRDDAEIAFRPEPRPPPAVGRQELNVKITKMDAAKEKV